MLLRGFDREFGGRKFGGKKNETTVNFLVWRILQLKYSKYPITGHLTIRKVIFFSLQYSNGPFVSDRGMVREPNIWVHK